MRTHVVCRCRVRDDGWWRVRGPYSHRHCPGSLVSRTFRRSGCRRSRVQPGRHPDGSTSRLWPRGTRGCDIRSHSGWPPVWIPHHDVRLARGLDASVQSFDSRGGHRWGRRHCFWDGLSDPVPTSAPHANPQRFWRARGRNRRAEYIHVQCRAANAGTGDRPFVRISAGSDHGAASTSGTPANEPLRLVRRRVKSDQQFFRVCPRTARSQRYCRGRSRASRSGPNRIPRRTPARC